MYTLNDISEMKTGLVESLNYEMRCEGYNKMDICRIGQIVDMIKDLAQAEKDCKEGCYYEAVVDAMYDYGFEGEFEIEAEGRMGYDTRRYSSGRYAPKGKGHYSPVHGYTPNMPTHIPPYMMDNSTPDHMNRMGYPMDGGHNGQAMNNYRTSKRYYTETKDHNEKSKMDHYAKEHMNESVASFKEIWHDADPELKKDMKKQLSGLLAEMQV